MLKEYKEKHYSEEIVRAISFTLNKKYPKPNAVYTLEVPSQDTIKYEQPILSGHRVYLALQGNKIMFSAGCQGSISLAHVNQAIAELEGTAVTTVKKSCIYLKTVPVTGTSRVEFLEESGNFLISKSLKAYKKEEYEVRDTVLNLAIFKSITATKASYKGYAVNLAGNGKDTLLNTLYYLKTIMDFVTDTYLTKTK